MEDGTHNNSVVPGKDGKLIKASNEIPSSSDVASYENAKSEDREGVHRSALCSYESSITGELLTQETIATGVRLF